jgi:uncharacterized membrane protein (UPF0127 family)
MIHRNKKKIFLLALVIGAIVFSAFFSLVSPLKKVLLSQFNRSSQDNNSDTKTKIKSCEITKKNETKSHVWCRQPKDYWTSTADHYLAQVQIGRRLLEVELVTTPESITQGLSGRDSIGSDGMLFLFSHPIAAQFWMKEMKFDLDLVWLVNQKVIGITENVPKPDQTISLDQLPLYSPPGPVNMVLEIPAGQAKEWQLEVGDEFVWTEKKL